MNGIEVNKKKPSEQLISLISELGSSIRNVKNLVKNIKKKGHEEGFSNFEIILLAREILRRSLSRRQLNYWFPIRGNWKKMEESSSPDSHGVNNDDKKGMEESHTQVLAPRLKASSIPLHSINTSLEQKDQSITDRRTIESSNARTPRMISFSDLVDPKSVDYSNHPMYQNAHEYIHQLKQALVEKKDETAKQLKEVVENKSLSLVAKKDPSSNFFQIAKDCDFTNEHFKERIEPIEAIQYLQQFVGRYRKIDFGFREVE